MDKATPATLKQFIASVYRRLPLPYWAQMWLIRRITPTFLVGVAGVILNNHGEILFLEHTFHRYYSWGLPSGWLGRGESPAQTLQRELREEVGLEIEIQALLIIEPGADPHQLQVGYLCRAVNQPLDLGFEILSMRWVSPDDLPEPLLPFHRALITCAVTLLGKQSDVP